jgi:hypothetical protein
MSTKLLAVEGLRARTLSLAVAAATAALASGAAAAEEWQWSATPYLWATDLGLSVTVADRGLVDAEIAFEDLVETIDTAALVRVEGMRGEHGMAFDLFNVELADSHDAPLTDQGDASLTLDAAVRLTIIDATGVYDAGGDGKGFSLLYGARVIEQRNDIEASLGRADTTSPARSYDATDTLVDALVGFRYSRELAHDFSYRFALDVSHGDTEYTWSAGPTIGYTFGADDRYELTAGYRHMVVKYDTAELVESEMSMSGLLLGFRIDF